MNLEVAKHGIDFVVANALKRKVSHFEVAYHGRGEPTVNWRVMVESLEHARQKAARLGLKVLAFSATNGVLTDKQIDWVIANLDGASISFDGLPAVHDTHRLTVLGNGSSHRLIHTLERFDTVDFPYGLRMTVTADQISMLPESV
jgi:uncharacterized protein